MTNHLDLFDPYDAYEYPNHSRRAHRAKGARKQKKKQKKQIAQEMNAMRDTAESFVPTYVKNLDPDHHERNWIIKSLGGFYENNQLQDVLHVVKAGKEANVYCCQATPAMHVPYLAAKIYRPRMLRHLKNNAVYKEGRMVLDADGKEERGSRAARALSKKTRFGKNLDIMTWIVHEYEMHQKLYDAGADVPEPIALQDKTILMAYVGEPYQPAPTLIDTRLDKEEARPLLNRILDNITLMLELNYVHGDLSPYNILYWDEAIQIIDFPQMVDARKNQHAEEMLRRDVLRVCEYFERYGVYEEANAFTDSLWKQYTHAEL